MTKELQVTSFAGRRKCALFAEAANLLVLVFECLQVVAWQKNIKNTQKVG